MKKNQHTIKQISESFDNAIEEANERAEDEKNKKDRDQRKKAVVKRFGLE